MRAPLLAIVASASLLALTCGTATPGAKPHEMSAAAHQREAEQHAGLAEQHGGEYRPDAGVERLRCTAPGGRPGPYGSAIIAEPICWTSVDNPTTAHLDEADKHRRHAADHRAASAALREAEARSCIGVSEADRDMSPFEHREDVVSVQPLVLSEADARARTPAERQLGALVKFRPVPGLTVEWLQRVVNCHLARNAALGHVVPEMPNCPLVPRGVEAQVSAAGDGLAVAIRADHPAVAREVLARTERLAPDGLGRPVNVGAR